MSDELREAFDNNENRDDLEFDSYESGCIDATAAADAKYREMIEKIKSARAKADHGLHDGDLGQFEHIHSLLTEALALAATVMKGGK